MREQKRRRRSTNVRGCSRDYNIYMTMIVVIAVTAITTTTEISRGSRRKVGIMVAIKEEKIKLGNSSSSN